MKDGYEEVHNAWWSRGILTEPLSGTKWKAF